MIKKLTYSLSLAALSLAALLPAYHASASPQPANKVQFAASNVETLAVDLTAGQTSQTVSLGKASLKTSSPTDLLFQFTAECALQTDVKTSGSTTGYAVSEAIAGANVWVEVDGVPVPVAALPSADDGTVSLCNRAFKMEMGGFTDQAQYIALYLKTKDAHAFNWAKLNLGSGQHAIEVKANLTANVSGTGHARALIGKRTLIVEPTKMANDAIF